MGFLDQMIGGMFESQGRPGEKPAIADALTDLLAPRGQQGISGNRGAASQPNQGGLEGLLDGLSRAGLGDVAESWIKPGQNRSVEPHQLEKILDNDKIDQLTRRTGLSRNELLQQLSDHLPDAVDRLTPQGRRPTPEDMGHW